MLGTLQAHAFDVIPILNNIYLIKTVLMYIIQSHNFNHSNQKAKRVIRNSYNSQNTQNYLLLFCCFLALLQSGHLTGSLSKPFSL